MRTNHLNFKNDIKSWIELKDKNPNWMHPIYCAYYIVKHQILDVEKQKAIIDDDIKRSYKALNNDWSRDYFRIIVNEYISRYPEEIVCTDKQ